MALITTTLARSLLPPRPDDSYKGTFGRVLIVAGSLQYPGAASLATGGAARIGAGLVTLAIGRSALVGPGRLPEVTLEVVSEAEWGYLGGTAADELVRHFDRYDALLVGPGIGRDDSTIAFLKHLLHLEKIRHRHGIGFKVDTASRKAKDGKDHKDSAKEHAKEPELPLTVIDADALTLLAAIDHWWEHLPRGRCILTPHPGEMKRLLRVDELDTDVERVAIDAAARWGQVVTLKGRTTVVADPSGKCLRHEVRNAALATAGTGDVLAGAIAGLLAQDLQPFDAAVLGVYLHGAAGGLLRKDLGTAGTIASDLLPRLPLAIRELRGD